VFRTVRYREETMRPSVRFEVFKRDGFKCAYCGRCSPDVVLEVDHVIPRVEGGDDDMLNLVTSCWDCNRGKGASLLGDVAPVPNIEEMTELVKERERQIRAYREAQGAAHSRRTEEFDEVWNYWFELQQVDELPRYYTPTRAALARYVEQLGPSEVKDAMDIAFDKKPYGNTITIRYFFGVLKGKLAQKEGRL
jgi:HNH endonuclease